MQLDVNPHVNDDRTPIHALGDVKLMYCPRKKSLDTDFGMQLCEPLFVLNNEYIIRKLILLALLLHVHLLLRAPLERCGGHDRCSDVSCSTEGHATLLQRVV